MNWRELCELVADAERRYGVSFDDAVIRAAEADMPPRIYLFGGAA